MEQRFFLTNDVGTTRQPYAKNTQNPDTDLMLFIKYELKMGHRATCKMQNYKTPRR